MKFLIVTSAPLIKKSKKYFAYSPYANEMEIWTKNTEEIAFCCPKWEDDKGWLVSEIKFPIHHKFWLRDFTIKSKRATAKLVPQLMINFWMLLKAMIWADHIHLRCPGNVGVLACFIQVLFPKKIKTAKYAGNWDPKARQPLSYKIQKWILSNTFLTKNMTVLVYGSWENQSKNIKPFFTASYSENEIEPVGLRPQKTPIEMLFVGTLSEGKRPGYVFRIVKKMVENGIDVRLKVFGDGVLKPILESYIVENQLQNYIVICGNVDQETLKKAYQKSHFLLLPSKSEGWPKVVAEAMFWGCVPFCTPISCVPSMIGASEERGLFLTMDLDSDATKIVTIFTASGLFLEKSQNGINWSQKFTTERFFAEIQQLLHD